VDVNCRLLLSLPANFKGAKEFAESERVMLGFEQVVSLFQ
jgi:hypothetical protein